MGGRFLLGVRVSGAGNVTLSDLPAPLLPKEVDLSDFQFMPLDARRLRDSRIAATVTGEEFRSAVLLWCASWHQVPAASLPDDDVELAQLAGFGRVVAAWREVRAGALHGWIECSDGRLYHPVVAEKAIEGWNSKLIHRWKKDCDRIRKENKSREEGGLPPHEIPQRPQEIQAAGHGIPTSPSAHSSGKSFISAGKLDDTDGTDKLSDGIPTETALKGQGQGQGQKKDMCPKPEEPVRTRKPYPEDFEQFWSAYPTDKLMSKLEAGKVWGKLTEDDRASAVAAIPGFVAHCRKDPTYRPVHANRFLSQRRFDGFDPKPKSVPSGPVVDDPVLEFPGGFKRPESFVRQAVADWHANPQSWPRMELGASPDSPGCRVPDRLLNPATRSLEPTHG